jgi:hypothetical protein
MVFCKMNDDDARKLTNTIVETDAAFDIYQKASKDVGFTPHALKVILDFYMESLKAHKALWRELLVKYIGEEDASKYYKVLRYDTIKKVIFRMEIEGCTLCEKE